MNNYINMKIGDMHFIQRNEYSKITVFFDDKTKITADNIESLPKNLNTLLNDAIKIKANLKEFFEYQYSAENNSYKITKYIGNGIKNVVIPESIDGIKVTINGHIFHETKEIEAIYLPDNIDKINSYFCVRLPDLEKVYLGKNISEIPECGFISCKNLKTINLENITEIKTNGFSGSKSLNNIDLRNIKTIMSGAFSYCDSLSDLVLPKINFLGSSAFHNCKNLKSVIFGEELTEIGYAAFMLCKNLKEVKLPSNLKIINDYAFCDCFSLNKINFPENLARIKDSAFYNTGLSGEIIFPNKLMKIGKEAFMLTEIDKINISKNTTYYNESFPIAALTNINFYDKKIKTKNIPNKER